ncbi:MAG: bifunctional phosphoribosylaminoimidazolecarboxamide formyltransferase/IMP cyclohydrolase [Fibrobacterota bacterium]
MDNKIKKALVSVSDKTGIADFCRELTACNIKIISTGGTARALKEAGIDVKTVDSVTGFPEIMDGRVKTLHPKIHGGLLAVRENPGHMKELEENGVDTIDMVVVNLYPFRETIAKEDCALADAVENIDIGGPTMLRSAAKNHRYVTVVTDPEDYDEVINQIKENGETELETRQRLAAKTFSHTADYDSAIDCYLSSEYGISAKLRLCYGSGQKMRYGENSHQTAEFYKASDISEASMASAVQLHGKELSYNNIVDGDAAIEAVRELAPAAAVSVIKHTNPCGLATGKDAAGALENAWQGDIVSAFGSVIACTVKIDLAAAELLKGRFVELLIAPEFTEDALEFLRSKSSSIRLLQIPEFKEGKAEKDTLRHVTGGILRQDRDTEAYSEFKPATSSGFPEDKKDLAVFAWNACKYTKSNAIVICREYEKGFFQVLGMGAGQPNRVDSLRKLSVTKAEENLQRFFEKESSGSSFEEYRNTNMAQAVLASDAFFPFPDTVEEAGRQGIKYIIQPGGSKRDAEVIEACEKAGIAMAFTGTRHFRH